MQIFLYFDDFQQNGTDHQTLLIVCSSIHSFLIWVSETNQTVFSKIRQDIWMLKVVEMFQHFPKIFTQLKIFLIAHQCFSFFYLAPKEFFFLNKTNSCSCSNWLKYYIKMLTLKLSAALLYRSGGVRNYFLYKAPIYLPIEDIKLFGQNGWSVQTWEPWLHCLTETHYIFYICLCLRLSLYMSYLCDLFCHYHFHFHYN